MEDGNELLKVIARPVGFAARAKRWAEEEERARQYKEDRLKRKAERREQRVLEVEGLKRPRRIWDNYIDFAYVQKSETRRIVISICTRDGYRYVAIREHYMRRSDGTWWPTPYGIQIPLVMALNKTTKPDPNKKPKMIYPMQGIMDVLPEAIEAAKTMELLNLENARWKVPKVTEEKQNEDQ